MPDYKLTHQPCDDCGSSDALCINYDESTFCHSCRKYTHPPLEGSGIAVRVPQKPLTGFEGFEATLAALATETFSSVPGERSERCHDEELWRGAQVWAGYLSLL